MKAQGKSVRQAFALLAVAFMVALVFAPLNSAQAAASPTEYQQFVHTYSSVAKGNYTSVEKPMFPVFINDSQIPIGRTWNIIEPLVAGHNYHVYCYGGWVNNGSQPKTDYDIYVYNPRGALESEHTEAAGLPEHLGTRINDTFFTPQTTGNYTFSIINDPRESKGAENATFMIIENVATDEWFTSAIKGKKIDGSSAINTAWAYEFVTDSPKIEVYVNVPDALDMYEARLYVMSNTNSSTINGSPLPWEPGLYGNLSGSVGGYNLNSEGYRGVAYASCECKGQDMLLTYSPAQTNTNTSTTTTSKTSSKTANATAASANATTTAKTLYQLVLIGEFGSGNVDVLVKTQFGDACLLPQKPPKDVRAGNETAISYLSNSTELKSAVLEYTVDGWNTTSRLAMKIENRTCNATIPKQKAGATVNYRVSANDTLMNTLAAEGNFTVKQYTTLNITLPQGKVYLGENATIQGKLTGANGSAQVIVQLMNANQTLDY
jgi:hypothetical protein